MSIWHKMVKIGKVAVVIMKLVDADLLKSILDKGEIVIDEDVEKCESMHEVLVYLLEKVAVFLDEAIDGLPEYVPEINVGEWIPCSERLPKVEDLHDVNIFDCTQYLIQRRCGLMDVAHYIRVYGDSYFEANTMEIKDVIAWMPLPQPYKGE